MKPYYQDAWVTIYHGGCREILPQLQLEILQVDLVLTDPPYGISFMGKDWDKALPDIEIWRQCLRVLKAGSFAFVMSIPRADCLSRMIISLEDAGFRVDFTPIFWTYASGFPKAQNIGKAVDKRLGVEREVVGESLDSAKRISSPNLEGGYQGEPNGRFITAPATPQAKALDGSYGGFQPKPAVEVIIVAMKPLSEKTFVDQALKNQKGITWLDDCRIPHNDSDLQCQTGHKGQPFETREHNFTPRQYTNQGRFLANLLVSDDVLNDGHRVQPAGNKVPQIRPIKGKVYDGGWSEGPKICDYYHDSGSFSRFFDLDKWWAKTFPFLIVPKASKSEKNKGLDIKKTTRTVRWKGADGDDWNNIEMTMKNNHPTVKPLKLMSYLITLGSREGGVVLDPFMGSGTTALASKLLGRKCIGIEIEEKYCEIAAKRCSQQVFDFRT